MQLKQTQLWYSRGLLSLSLICGLVMFTSLVLAQSPPQSDIGRIAFASGRFRTEIYTMNADGSNIVQLTDIGNARDPSWSPDVSRIVFVAWLNDHLGLHLVDADNSNLTTLINYDGDEYAISDPVWSPDGSMIAYVLYSEHADIYVIDLDSSIATRLTDNGADNGNMGLDWSPDGSQIVFTSDLDSSYGNRNIYVMNSDGTDTMRLTEHEWADHRHPVWSPDGNRIIFVSDRTGGLEIYAMDSDGRNISLLVSDRPSNLLFSDFDWSPTGEQIVFTGCQGTVDSCEIYVMDADGSNLVQLTDNDHFDSHPSWEPVGAGTHLPAATATLNMQTTTIYLNYNE